MHENQNFHKSHRYVKSFQALQKTKTGRKNKINKNRRKKEKRKEKEQKNKVKEKKKKMSGFPKDDRGFYLTLSIIKGFCNADSVQVYSIETDLEQVVVPFDWEKNRN